MNPDSPKVGSGSVPGPKVSIVTVAYNCASSILPTMQSVFDQTYSNIEYIVVDGASKDQTLELVLMHRDKIAHIVSEPDSNMYDGINKGIRLATGEVFGLIHAGDRLYSRDTIAKIAAAFTCDQLDAVYGHSVHVDKADKVVRENRSPPFSLSAIRRGWMPSHQGIYIKKRLIESHGDYRTDLGGDGDYEFFIRHFYKHTIGAKLVNDFVVRFSLGGSSTTNYHRLFKRQLAHVNCWRINGLSPPPFLVTFKLARKVPQFFRGLLSRVLARHSRED